MVQNLKVDIIYHRSSSDFEMEFNLCGCCRMRMLSDKTNDKKGFVKALARDVARSRVIIACGPLFGADGLINVVGIAIGNGTTICDNKTYGINGDEEICIINGSTPLVTPDGYFGGCIIESGPQTIILLTENKTFRKAIMQNLIHPYIEEICYIPTKSSPIAPPQEEAPVQVPATADEVYLTEPDEEYEEFTEASVDIESAPQPDEHNIDFIMDTEEETPEEAAPAEAEPSAAFDDTYKMYAEIETPEEIRERYENPYQPSESDNMFLATPEVEEIEENDQEEIPKKNTDSLQSLNIAIVVLTLLVLLSLLALVYFVVLKPMSMNMSIGEYIKQIFSFSKAFIKLI